MARFVGMPGPTAGSAVPVGRARTLAQVYGHFGEVDAAETSPLYERVAVALSESDEALRAIEAAPAHRRHPTVILAALHDLALAGRAPALAAAYAAADGDAAAGAAIDTLLGMTDSVVTIAVPDQRDRTLRRAVSGHCRGGAPGRRQCGWADLRGLFGWAQSRCRSRWHHVQQRTIAGRPVISRAAVVFDRGRPAHPDAGDARGRRPGRRRPRSGRRDRRDDARWLRACLWPDQPERVARLEAAWRSSTARLCAPRQLAAAGRRAAGWRGWPPPRAVLRTRRRR